MARYRKRRSSSLERALQHIREAEELSEELGGTDQDVKNYFFSLNGQQLKEIFDKYGEKYGSSPREYAERTLTRWKSRRTHMSGLVATRLFNLLPPLMPLKKKFQLTESLWSHIGPSSKKIYYIGLDANLGELRLIIEKHFQEVVVNYKIPDSLEKRFSWLSQGDVDIKQQLLNHFRQHEKSLLSEVLGTKLPLLIDHLGWSEEGLTTQAMQSLNVGKHEVQIHIKDQINGITENRPRERGEPLDYIWIWWIIGIFVLVWIFNK